MRFGFAVTSLQLFVHANSVGLLMGIGFHDYHYERSERRWNSIIGSWGFLVSMVSRFTLKSRVVAHQLNRQVQARAFHPLSSFVILHTRTCLHVSGYIAHVMWRTRVREALEETIPMYSLFYSLSSITLHSSSISSPPTSAFDYELVYIPTLATSK